MKPKDYLTNKKFCPMPWTGLMYNVDGKVKYCIRSANEIGNIKDTALSLKYIGYAYSDSGYFDEALLHYNKALKINTQLI